MTRIDRPAIIVNVEAIAVAFLELLCLVVMQRAQALQFAEPEQALIASMRHDMIGRVGSNDLT